jgi:hypothetical protein
LSTRLVTMSSSRAVTLTVFAWTIALAATPTHAFYLPGVAPQDFAPVRRTDHASPMVTLRATLARTQTRPARTRDSRTTT